LGRDWPDTRGVVRGSTGLGPVGTPAVQRDSGPGLRIQLISRAGAAETIAGPGTIRDYHDAAVDHDAILTAINEIRTGGPLHGP
jgi:hypothetical protein